MLPPHQPTRREDASPLVGISPWSERIRTEIQVAARHSSTVLVTGPSGTGKELISRAIHDRSDRSGQPFVPVDCAAACDSLFASQLFGHVKGAFTGAQHESMGAFRAACGGTIFLDELGELSLPLQAKLLRTLQQRVVIPVGGLEEYPVDVRVVAATNRDLQEEVEAGRFRADLYFRLNVFCLETQSLRHRPEDIQPLVKAILHHLQVRHGIGCCGVSERALRILSGYSWPGNVRELGNALERAAILCDQLIEVEHLPVHLQRIGAEQESQPADGTSSFHDWPTMAQVERQHLEHTLRHAQYNQSAAARLLGMDRNAVRRMASRLGVRCTPSGNRAGNLEQSRCGSRRVSSAIRKEALEG